MASDTEASCVDDPNFAVICNFLEKFGSLVGITVPDICELQEMLENNQEVPLTLITLHVKLLRRAKRAVSSTERWERALLKFCHEYCTQEAWELERFGYKKVRLLSRIKILKILLEMQFDLNPKFKVEVNRQTAKELRTEAIGRDKHGFTYWYQLDDECQIRVYREDPDEETWTLMAKDREGLVQLISQLCSDDPASNDLALNEDSSSLELEKPIVDTGQETAKEIPKEEPEEIKADEVENTPTIEEVVEKPAEIQAIVGIDLRFSKPPDAPKSVDLTSKRKKSINDLAADLRIKSQDILNNCIQEQEMDLSMKKSRNKSEEIDLPSHLKQQPQRLNRPKLFINKKAKPESEDEDDDDEVIEEPMMLIRGEGSGRDCNSENAIANQEEYGEAIEEPLMIFYGEGAGCDCDTGNTDKDDEREKERKETEEDSSANAKTQAASKIGTIIYDLKSDSKILMKSPTKKLSRWDVRKTETSLGESTSQGHSTNVTSINLANCKTETTKDDIHQVKTDKSQLENKIEDANNKMDKEISAESEKKVETVEKLEENTSVTSEIDKERQEKSISEVKTDKVNENELQESENLVRESADDKKIDYSDIERIERELEDEDDENADNPLDESANANDCSIEELEKEFQETSIIDRNDDSNIEMAKLEKGLQETFLNTVEPETKIQENGTDDVKITVDEDTESVEKNGKTDDKLEENLVIESDNDCNIEKIKDEATTIDLEERPDNSTAETAESVEKNHKTDDKLEGSLVIGSDNDCNIEQKDDATTIDVEERPDNSKANENVTKARIESTSEKPEKDNVSESSPMFFFGPQCVNFKATNKFDAPKSISAEPGDNVETKVPFVEETNVDEAVDVDGAKTSESEDILNIIDGHLQELSTSKSTPTEKRRTKDFTDDKKQSLASDIQDLEAELNVDSNSPPKDNISFENDDLTRQSQNEIDESSSDKFEDATSNESSFKSLERDDLIRPSRLEINKSSTEKSAKVEETTVKSVEIIEPPNDDIKIECKANESSLTLIEETKEDPDATETLLNDDLVEKSTKDDVEKTENEDKITELSVKSTDSVDEIKEKDRELGENTIQPEEIVKNTTESSLKSSQLETEIKETTQPKNDSENIVESSFNSEESTKDKIENTDLVQVDNSTKSEIEDKITESSMKSTDENDLIQVNDSTKDESENNVDVVKNDDDTSESSIKSTEIDDSVVHSKAEESTNEEAPLKSTENQKNEIQTTPTLLESTQKFDDLAEYSKAEESKNQEALLKSTENDAENEKDEIEEIKTTQTLLESSKHKKLTQKSDDLAEHSKAEESRNEEASLKTAEAVAKNHKDKIEEIKTTQTLLESAENEESTQKSDDLSEHSKTEESKLEEASLKSTENDAENQKDDIEEIKTTQTLLESAKNEELTQKSDDLAEHSKAEESRNEEASLKSTKNDAEKQKNEMEEIKTTQVLLESTENKELTQKSDDLAEHSKVAESKNEETLLKSTKNQKDEIKEIEKSQTLLESAENKELTQKSDDLAENSKTEENKYEEVSLKTTEIVTKNRKNEIEEIKTAQTLLESTENEELTQKSDDLAENSKAEKSKNEEPSLKSTENQKDEIKEIETSETLLESVENEESSQKSEDSAEHSKESKNEEALLKSTENDAENRKKEIETTRTLLESTEIEESTQKSDDLVEHSKVEESKNAEASLKSTENVAKNQKNEIKEIETTQTLLESTQKSKIKDETTVEKNTSSEENNASSQPNNDLIKKSKSDEETASEESDSLPKLPENNEELKINETNISVELCSEDNNKNSKVEDIVIEEKSEIKKSAANLQPFREVSRNKPTFDDNLLKEDSRSAAVSEDSVKFTTEELSAPSTEEKSSSEGGEKTESVMEDSSMDTSRGNVRDFEENACMESLIASNKPVHVQSSEKALNFSSVVEQSKENIFIGSKKEERVIANDTSSDKNIVDSSTEAISNSENNSNVQLDEDDAMSTVIEEATDLSIKNTASDSSSRSINATNKKVATKDKEVVDKAAKSGKNEETSNHISSSDLPLDLQTKPVSSKEGSKAGPNLRSSRTQQKTLKENVKLQTTEAEVEDSDAKTETKNKAKEATVMEKRNKDRKKPVENTMRTRNSATKNNSLNAKTNAKRKEPELILTNIVKPQKKFGKKPTEKVAASDEELKQSLDNISITSDDSFGEINAPSPLNNDFDDEPKSDTEKSMSILQKELSKPAELIPQFVEIHKPLLMCVDIEKLKAKPPEPKLRLKPLESLKAPVETVITIEDNDSNDIIIAESDPLACTEEDLLRVHKTIPATKHSPVTRSLRNRQIIPFIDITKQNDNGRGKRGKPRGRKPLNFMLRKSVVEVKPKSDSSSDEEPLIVAPAAVQKTPNPRGRPRGRGRGRGRGIGRPPRVVTDSPAVSSDAHSETSRTEVIAAPPAAKKKNVQRLLGLDIDPSVILQAKKSDKELNTRGSLVRQSRRIAQIKIKEDAERRKDHEFTLVGIKEHHKKYKKKKANDDKEYKETSSASTKIKKQKKLKVVLEDSDDEDENDEQSADEAEDGSKKKHLKKKKKHQDLKRLFDMENPWQSSSESSTSHDEDEEIEADEASEEETPFLRSDHEFSPESDLENSNEPQPLRRARTVKKESDTEDPQDEHACQKCNKSDHPEWILLCDTCDCGWHCSCLRPALFVIPEGDWFCPPCQHVTLVNNLKAELVEYDRKLNKHEMEARRKQRLAYVGISLDNVLPAKEQDRDVLKPQVSDSDSDDDSNSSSGSSSGSESEPIYQLRERRQAHSYRFNDYDDLINSAIQEEIEAVKGAGNQGRGKDIATIVNAEKEEKAQAQVMLQQQQPGKEENGEELRQEEAIDAPPPVVPVYTKSTEEKEDKSDEDTKHLNAAARKKHRKLNCLDVSSEDDIDDEDFKGTSEDDEEELEEDFGSVDSDDELGRRGRHRREPTRRSTRAKITRYDREFINDNSEDEAPRKRKSRGWEETESEDSDKSWGARKRNKKKFAFSKPSKRSKKKKRKRGDDDDDLDDVKVPRAKKPRIKYGGLNDSDDEVLTRRTRGKKINYIDALGSDTEEEGTGVKRTVKPIESEDEYVGNEEDEDEEAPLAETKESSESEPEKPPPTPPTPPTPQTKKPETEEQEEEEEEGEISAPELTKESQQPSPAPLEATKKDDTLHPAPTDEDATDEEESQKTAPEIPVIAANPEDLDEEEVGMMMEEEEYANKQLELMAIQLAKEKKRKEKEAKKLEKKLEKKRGRKKKDQNEVEAKTVPPLTINTALLNKVSPVMPTMTSRDDMDADMEPSSSLSPVMPVLTSEAIPVTVNEDVEVSKPKRRGRGKGKKTMAATTEPGNKLGVATPPQPFGQSQPTPSVITRMLQAQPMMTPHKYFNSASSDQAPFIRYPAPPTQQRQIYHTGHHPMDPSPSGGTINKSTPQPSAHVRQQIAPPSSFQAVAPAYSTTSPYHGSAQGFHYSGYSGPASGPAAAAEEVSAAHYQFSYASNDEGSNGLVGEQQDEEGSVGGEFGGLVSYFSSQREDDLDT